MHLERCIKPKDFWLIIASPVHNFVDDSEQSNGTSRYFKIFNSEGKIHCAFLFGKAYEPPLKAVTIPRLEYMAALSAVRVNNMITGALEIPVQGTVFLTDSTTTFRDIRI